jgi:hypothetical protein
MEQVFNDLYISFKREFGLFDLALAGSKIPEPVQAPK